MIRRVYTSDISWTMVAWICKSRIVVPVCLVGVISLRSIRVSMPSRHRLWIVRYVDAGTKGRNGVVVIQKMPLVVHVVAQSKRSPMKATVTASVELAERMYRRSTTVTAGDCER
jgi:hypothetical protein